MTKATLEKKLILNELTNINNASGYLILKSSETITLDTVRAVVFREARGLMAGVKDEVLSFDIISNKKLGKAESCEIPFSFNASGFGMNAYVGKNVSFSYSVEIQIDVGNEDVEKLKRSLFSKLKSFVTADYTIKISEYFKLGNISSRYQVVEEEVEFGIHLSWVLILLTVLFFGCIYFSIMQEFNSVYIFSGIALSVLIGYLILNYIEKSLGGISMKTINVSDGFVCKLMDTNKFNLLDTILYYEIIEKVIDNRGTSTSEYTEVIYSSPKRELTNIQSSPELKFLYPQRNGLHSCDYGYASLLWKMKLEGKYLGLRIKYSCIFNVDSMYDE